MLKGLKNKINSIWVVGSGIKLEHEIKMKAWWSKTPGLVFIDIPESALDDYITIIALSLADGEVSLFSN
jgi:alpha-L-fucosidase